MNTSNNTNTVSSISLADLFSKPTSKDGFKSGLWTSKIKSMIDGGIIAEDNNGNLTHDGTIIPDWYTKASYCYYVTNSTDNIDDIRLQIAGNCVTNTMLKIQNGTTVTDSNPNVTGVPNSQLNLAQLIQMQLVNQLQREIDFLLEDIKENKPFETDVSKLKKYKIAVGFSEENLQVIEEKIAKDKALSEQFKLFTDNGITVISHTDNYVIGSFSLDNLTRKDYALLVSSKAVCFALKESKRKADIDRYNNNFAMINKLIPWISGYSLFDIASKDDDTLLLSYKPTK